MKNITFHTLSEIQKQLMDNIIPNLKTKTKLPIAIMMFPVSEMIYSLNKYANWLYNQIFPSTADSKALNQFGLMYRVSRQHATYAELKIIVTGTESKTIPINTRFISTDTQVVYISTEPKTIISGTASVTIKATKAGTIGNLPIGAKVNFVQPQTDFVNTAIVGEGVTAAIEAEDTESYRTRILNTMIHPPQGGSIVDYIKWGMEVEGVANVFPYSGTTTGDVDIYIESTDTNDEGKPSSGLLTKVNAYISSAYRKPVTARINMKEIERVKFDVTLVNLQASDKEEVIKQITAQLKNYLYVRHGNRIGYDLSDTAIISVFDINILISSTLLNNNATVDNIQLDSEDEPNTYRNTYTLTKGQCGLFGALHETS